MKDWKWTTQASQKTWSKNKCERAHSTGMFRRESAREKMRSRCIQGGEAADADQVNDRLCHNCSFTVMSRITGICPIFVAHTFWLRTSEQLTKRCEHGSQLSTRAKARAQTNWGYPQLLPAVYIERDECERGACKSYFWSRLTSLYKIDANPRQCRRYTACRFSSFNYFEFFADWLRAQRAIID